MAAKRKEECNFSYVNRIIEGSSAGLLCMTQTRPRVFHLFPGAILIKENIAKQRT